MMRLFQSGFSLFLIAIGLPLLFMPKVNIITFSDETAGLRLDDMFLMCASVAILWGHVAIQKRLGAIETWALGVTLISLLSFVINRLLVAGEFLHVDAKIFYALRILEYFIFFYIGTMASRFLRLSSLLIAFFLWNVLLMGLQRLQIVGVFSVDGYMLAGDRIYGISSFGAEAALLLNFLYCYLVFDEATRQQMVRLFPSPLRPVCIQAFTYVLFILFAILIAQTGARIALVALLVSFCSRIYADINWRSPQTLFAPFVVAFGCLSLIAAFIWNNRAVVGRSVSLLSMKNFSIIGDVWETISISQTPIGNETYYGGGYDTSWWMRIHKWCYALKIYYLNPECYLQGIGPGFGFAGLDGGWVRIFTETGLLGLLAYALLFRNLSKLSPAVKAMMMAFYINMIFFDAYLAYKPMSLLFLIAGYLYQESRKNMPYDLNRPGAMISAVA
jgi:hypothetical protein